MQTNSIFTFASIVGVSFRQNLDIVDAIIALPSFFARDAKPAWSAADCGG